MALSDSTTVKLSVDLVKLTAADGKDVYITPAHVVTVRLPAGDDAGTVRVVLTVDVEGDGNKMLIVKGKLRDVARKLGADIGGPMHTVKVEA